jgi:hypothetical protein
VTANMADIMAQARRGRAPADHNVDVTSEVWTATILRVRRILPLLAVTVLVTAGCSDINDAIDGGINSVAEQALEQGISQQLADAGVELQSGPDCSTDLARDGGTLDGTATCDGTTVEGYDVAATFDGTLSGSGCAGTITIVVDGRTVVDGQEIPDCSVTL